MLCQLLVVGLGFLVWRRHDKKKRRQQWNRDQGYQVYGEGPYPPQNNDYYGPRDHPDPPPYREGSFIKTNRDVKTPMPQYAQYRGYDEPQQPPQMAVGNEYGGYGNGERASRWGGSEKGGQRYREI